MPLIPQPDSVSMTPWHCAVAVDIHGNFKTSHAGALRNTYDIVYKNGRSYFFRERSPLYAWDARVEFEHLYGRGLVIHNMEGVAQKEESLSDSDRKKLASLTVLQGGRVTLKGFL